MSALHKRLAARSKGFTLLELVVVMIIIAVLAAVAIPAYLGQMQRAQESAVIQNLTVAYHVEKAAAIANSGLPRVLAAAGAGAGVEPFDTGDTVVSDIVNSEPEMKDVYQPRGASVPASMLQAGQAAVCSTTTGDVLDSPSLLAIQEDTAGGTPYLLVASSTGDVPSFNGSAGMGLKPGVNILQGSCSAPGSGNGPGPSGGNTSGPTTAPKSTSAPTLNGSAIAGDTLTLSPGSWTPTAGLNLAAVWYDCSSPLQTPATGCVPSATQSGATYTISSADAGQYMLAQVTATNTAGASTQGVYSGLVLATPASGTVTVSPATDNVGTTLTASPSGWMYSPDTYNFQWFDCPSSIADPSTCNQIHGATSATYTVAGSDRGFYLMASVTAKNAAGTSAPAYSSISAAPALQAPTMLTAPSITDQTSAGAFNAGDTLQVSNGTWDDGGSGALTYSYKWYDCPSAGSDLSSCTAITGATSQTYQVRVGDQGSTIAAQVTANNGQLSTTASPAYASSSGVSQATLVFGQTDMTHNLPNNGDMTGAGLNLYTSGTAPFPNYQTEIAIDPLTGGFYVTDSGDDRVLYYPSISATSATVVYGQPSLSVSAVTTATTVTANTLWDPMGVAVDANGNLYVADYLGSRVVEFPVNGSTHVAQTTATNVWGQGGSFTTTSGTVSKTGLKYPSSIAFDSNGDMYVAGGPRVVEYPPNNGCTAPNTPAGCSTAQGVYGQNGSFTSSTQGDTASTFGPGNGQPAQIAIDSANDLFVADAMENRVLEFAPNNGCTAPNTPAGCSTAKAVYGQAGSFTSGGPGQGSPTASNLTYPGAMAFDANGNLFVDDTLDNRVFEYAANSGCTAPNTPAGCGTAEAVFGQNGSFTTLTAATTQTGLRNPTGLAIDSSGHVFIGDAANNRVMEYSASSVCTAPNNPTNCGKAANVYGQADYTHSAPNRETVSASALSGPGTTAIDPLTGGLYVADTANARVLYYPSATSTTPTAVYGQGGSYTSSATGVSMTAFTSPTAVAVDSSGNLYVVDGSRILMLPVNSSTHIAKTTATTVYGQFGSSTSNAADNNGSGGTTGVASAQDLKTPTAIAVDSQGDLWVADKGNNRVIEYPANNGCTSKNVPAGCSTAETVYGQVNLTNETTGFGPTGLTVPTGVAVDSSGNVYVADSGNNRVVEFAAGSASGASATAVYGQASLSGYTSGTTAGLMQDPQGVAVDSNGNLYVADTGNNRLLYFPAGASSATAVYGQNGSFTTSSKPGTNSSTLTPTSVTLGFSAGQLFITDQSSNRVIEFPPAS